MDEYDWPRHGKKTVSPTEELALKHDIAYRDAASLNDKHEAVWEMLVELDEVSTSGVAFLLANKAARAVLWVMFKIGITLEDAEARDFANELHACVLRQLEKSKASEVCSPLSRC